MCSEQDKHSQLCIRLPSPRRRSVKDNQRTDTARRSGEGLGVRSPVLRQVLLKERIQKRLTEQASAGVHEARVPEVEAGGEIPGVGVWNVEGAKQTLGPPPLIQEAVTGCGEAGPRLRGLAREGWR